MAVMDRQFFIDMAAVFILPEVTRRSEGRESAEQCARMAYNAAEALWNERERRFQEASGSDEPAPAPTRVGPEF